MNTVATTDATRFLEKMFLVIIVSVLMVVTRTTRMVLAVVIYSYGVDAVSSILPRRSFFARYSRYSLLSICPRMSLWSNFSVTIEGVPEAVSVGVFFEVINSVSVEVPAIDAGQAFGRTIGRIG